MAGADIHTTAGRIADLEQKLDEAVHAGSARAVDKQHARGKKTARERIDLLLDKDSFVELDEFARHRATAVGVAASRPYGDGVVTVGAEAAPIHKGDAVPVQVGVAHAF